MPSPADDYEAHRKIGRWVRLMIVHPATPASADAGGEPGAATVVGPAAATRTPANGRPRCSADLITLHGSPHILAFDQPPVIRSGWRRSGPAGRDGSRPDGADEAALRADKLVE